TKEHYIWLELRVNDALGSSQNVITAGEKLQRLFPQSKAIIQSCFMLGHAYYKEGKYDKSVITFDKYMTLSGKNAEPLAYFYIGMAYYKIKNYKKALNFLLKAKDVISKTGKDKKGDADKLVENIKVCIEELTLTFADSYYYLEKYILALQTYLDYLQRFPKSDNIPYVLYQLGYIYLKLKEVEKAEKYFNDLMKDYKGNFWSEQAKFIFENEKIKMNFANQRK
ncbi:tetratricopeptide repeat protein, partial [bacterium]|nr:tetratricopeptide repeat protein [bacterium]